MLIKPLLKRSFILIFLINIYAFCSLKFCQAIGIDIITMQNAALPGIGLLSATMWLIYQNLKDQHELLETAPTIWLVLLSLGSLLSSIVFSVNFMEGWIKFVPPILQTNRLLIYTSSILLLLCNMILSSIIYSMAFHTGQALKKKLLD